MLFACTALVAKAHSTRSYAARAHCLAGSTFAQYQREGRTKSKAKQSKAVHLIRLHCFIARWPMASDKKALSFKYNKGRTEEEILASLYDVDAYYDEHPPAPPPDPDDEDMLSSGEPEEEGGAGPAPAEESGGKKAKASTFCSSAVPSYYDRVTLLNGLTCAQDYALPMLLDPPAPSHVNVAMDSRTPGYELLVKMGWRPGSALGAASAGAQSHALTEPVPIVVKRDKAGVGAHPHASARDREQAGGQR